MAEKRQNILGGYEIGASNVCAILGTFTAEGVDIVYKNLQASVLNFEHVDLDIKDEGEVSIASGKRGTYVR